ncbi:MAG: ATPase, T2SS/T4P/T4SS family, partial [Acidimicrobiia bacterium]
MGVVERISRAIAESEIPLSRGDVTAEAGRLLDVESPLRRAEAIGGVVDRVIGLGPIQRLFDDANVSDILVNGHSDVWVDRGRGLEKVGIEFVSDEDLVATVERVIAPLGLRVDRSAPMVDARLPDGSRLHAVLPPAAVGHPLVAIRRFTQRVTSLEELVGVGTATDDQVQTLVDVVRERRTIVVSGGTGTG